METRSDVAPRPAEHGPYRGTALEVIERMGLADAVRDHRMQIKTLSAVRGRGPRTYDVAIRPLHDARGDREIEIMRDDLVRCCSALSTRPTSWWPQPALGDPAARGRPGLRGNRRAKALLMFRADHGGTYTVGECVRPNVTESRQLATHGLATLIPATRAAIQVRNQA